MDGRFVGIDIGAETLKVVELAGSNGDLRWHRRTVVEHHKEPGARLLDILRQWNWGEVAAAAVTGRMSRRVTLPRIPTQQALSHGARFLFGDEPLTIVSIGGHGFSVLERRSGGSEVYRENSRCSQGTGNFLRQLVSRFDLSIEEASAAVEGVEKPAPLSGRCPVILKTDMTHLANKGENHPRILAGLFDAVCENVQVLIKPRVSPPRIALTGGVSRSRRVRDHFRTFLERHGMELDGAEPETALFTEALGCAVLAAADPAPPPAVEGLLAERVEESLERVPPLSASLDRVRRMPAVPPLTDSRPRAAILGLDIGSTGSKAVALDVESARVLWEGYRNTNGDPVGAARELVRKFSEGPAGHHRLVATGATGSGREIVGSLLATCYGPERVFILNEIAAHATGALHFDDRVDTIFEIGGQDAKYIRLAGGRVVEAAMNEACSAGTGSFIEEQGRRFEGIDDLVQLGCEAVEADCGISLGQHCSVFMAQIIDEAVASGLPQRPIIAGVYDSIVQNYLNRVKGNRTVGDVVFCQGMPFSADALAAAVARQTGSEVIVPPNPGTVGALGIALLARKELDLDDAEALDPERVLSAEVTGKDTFVCKSTKGCGGAGNRCRIDQLRTLVEGRKQKFTWGGNCSLFDSGTRKHKLPDRAPDPFREREELAAEKIAELAARNPDGPRVAMTDEFTLKQLFVFFATFVAELGLRPEVPKRAGQAMLKRGIEESNVAFCAPVQLFHGVVSAMAETEPDHILLPMLRTLPRTAGEEHGITCPMVQAAPDLLLWDLPPDTAARVVSPVIDVGRDNLASEELQRSCRDAAAALGLPGEVWREAYEKACEAQRDFDARCLDLGRRALDFCRDTGSLPVVVLGRPYTIYNKVLNSNVPALLREQGAVAVPVDCYPLDGETVEVPVFEDMYWAYGQRNLRAAHHIRRSPDVYSVWCSNYACGPDSFALHFYAYIMEGKPFAVIETDGHSGDAGTKTRLEAFLYCVHEDREARLEQLESAPPRSLRDIERDKRQIEEVRQRGERLLIPRMGPGAELVAAAFRGQGIRAECLPLPDHEALGFGRRHTSGKECVPMTITLGSLLQRLEKEHDSDERFAFLMGTACGPCRFGVYNVLHKIALERLGWKDRVRVVTASDQDYFRGLAKGFEVLLIAGVVGIDMLLMAYQDVRAVETRPGAAREIYERYREELTALVEEEARGELALPSCLLQVAHGRLFGVSSLLRRAAREFAALRNGHQVPTVLMVGEIYVRLDPFANDFLADKLQQRGLRTVQTPVSEWLEYASLMALRDGAKSGFGAHFSNFVQTRIQEIGHRVMAKVLGWPPRTTVLDALEASAPYMRSALRGEAVLTLGGPIHEWRHGDIDGVVSVGPLECMPSKIAEAQFFHVAEREGLPSLSVPVNGDPLDPEVLDSFVFDVESRFRNGGRTPPPPVSRPGAAQAAG